MKDKLFTYLVLFLIWGSNNIFAQDLPFESGLELISLGKQEDAIKLWSDMPLQERDTYEWVANMAMVQELTEDYVEAKMKWLFLQKKYGPDPLIQKRLQVLNKHLGIEHNEPNYLWGITLKNHLISGKVWVNILITLGILSIILSFWSKNLLRFKKLMSSLRVVILILFLGVLTQWLWQSYQLKQIPDQVLLSTQNLNYETQEKIHWEKGTSVVVLSHSGAEVKVKNRLGEIVVLPESAVGHFKF